MAPIRASYRHRDTWHQAWAKAYKLADEWGLFLLLQPSGGKLWRLITNLAHFIDTRSGKLLDSVPVGTRPRFALFLNGGRTVWVSSEQRGTISVFDAASRRILHTIDLTQNFNIPQPVQAVEMRATRDERRVFVAMGRSNRVAEIDPATFAVVRWFPTGERTWGIGLSPDETRLYAASGIAGTLTIIDLKRNAVARTLNLGGKPWGAIAAPR